MAKENRFKEVKTEGNPLANFYSIIVDTETGVNYFWLKNGTAGGLTPLLDSDGKVIITKPENKEN